MIILAEYTFRWVQESKFAFVFMYLSIKKDEIDFSIGLFFCLFCPDSIYLTFIIFYIYSPNFIKGKRSDSVPWQKPL